MANNRKPPETRSFIGYSPYDDLDRIILRAAEIIANQSPYDTGNLRIKAIRVEWIDTEHMAFRIYIDESAILTKTGGKLVKDPDGNTKIQGGFDYQEWLETNPRSPHRGWFERACADAANYIRSVIG